MDLHGWHRDDRVQTALLALYLGSRGYEKQAREILLNLSTSPSSSAGSGSPVRRAILNGDYQQVIRWLSGDHGSTKNPLGHLLPEDASVGVYLANRACFFEAVVRAKIQDHNYNLLEKLNEELIPLQASLIGPSKALVFPWPPENEQQLLLLLVMGSPQEAMRTMFQATSYNQSSPDAFASRCIGQIRESLAKDFAMAAKDDSETTGIVPTESVPPDFLYRLLQHAYTDLERVHPFSLPLRSLGLQQREIELLQLPQSKPSLKPPPHFPSHLLHTLQHHQTNEVWIAKFSPLGRFLVLGLADGVLVIYDVHHKFEVVARLQSDPGKDHDAMVGFNDTANSKKAKSIMYCCWDPTEQYLVSSSVDTLVRVWWVGGLNRKHKTRSQDDFKLRCCFMVGLNIKAWTCEFLPVPHGEKPAFIIGSMDKKLKAFDIDGKELFDFFGDTEEAVQLEKDDGPVNSFQRVTDLSITPNGKILITTNNNKKVHFYSIPSLVNPLAVTKCLASISLGGRLTSCTISTSGNYLLFNVCPDELQVWCIEPLDRGEPPYLVRKLCGYIQDDFTVRSSFGYVARGPGGVADEQLALTGSKDGYVYIWKLASGDLVTRIRAHEGLVSSVEWNRNHQVGPNDARDFGQLWCSVSDDHTVKIWGPQNFYA